MGKYRVAIEDTKNSLFWLCGFLGFSMLLVAVLDGLKFFDFGFLYHYQIKLLYLAFLGGYLAVKTSMRYVGKSYPARLGELFVWLWGISAGAIYLLSVFLPKLFELNWDIVEVSMEVVIVYTINEVLKHLVPNKCH